MEKILFNQFVELPQIDPNEMGEIHIATYKNYVLFLINNYVLQVKMQHYTLRSHIAVRIDDPVVFYNLLKSAVKCKFVINRDTNTLEFYISGGWASTQYSFMMFEDGDIMSRVISKIPTLKKIASNVDATLYQI